MARNPVEHRIHELVVVENRRARFDVVDFGMGIDLMLFLALQKLKKALFNLSQKEKGARLAPDDEGKKITVDARDSQANGPCPVPIRDIDRSLQAPDGCRSLLFLDSRFSSSSSY